MLSTENNENGSIIFYRQLTPEKKILVDFLTNKTNNNKWRSHARRKLFAKQENNISGCLEAEDYVNEAKDDILAKAVITIYKDSDPLFTITNNGKTTSGDLQSLNTYILTSISHNISNFLRQAEKTEPLIDPDDDDEIKKKINPSLVVEFNDPCNNPEKYLSKQFHEICITTLGQISPRHKAVFEYKLENVPNRVIAKKLNITVRDVENTLKSIPRRLKPISHLSCI